MVVPALFGRTPNGGSIPPVFHTAAGQVSTPADGYSPSTTPPVEASQFSSIYRKAPLWAGQAALGKLPAVDQRLPKDPMLIQPRQWIGLYGVNILSDSFRRSR